MTATEIARRLADRAEDVAAHLLQGGGRHGREWLAGSVQGEAGSSLHVILEGERAGVWRDFAGADDDRGDLIGLWQRARNVSLSQACREAMDWLNVPHHERNTRSIPAAPKARVPREPDQRWLDLQAQMRAPSITELQQIAALRHLPNTAALQIASNAGHLFVAHVHDAGENHPAWLITDSTRRNAQARKMDGSLWVFNGKRKPAKAKTIWGTDNSWPIGAADITTDHVLFTEGGPDLLAAHHLIWRTGQPANPVAMFGDSNPIDEAALARFAGKLVQFFPHADADGQGQRAAARWATQLMAVTDRIEFFRFPKDIKDLNDFVTAEEGSAT